MIDESERVPVQAHATMTCPTCGHEWTHEFVVRASEPPPPGLRVCPDCGGSDGDGQCGAGHSTRMTCVECGKTYEYTIHVEMAAEDLHHIFECPKCGAELGDE